MKLHWTGVSKSGGLGAPVAYLPERPKSKRSKVFMITSEDVLRNIPKAVQWVTKMEQACMKFGQQLSPQGARDAQAVGVRQIGLVRVMVLSEIPLPSDPELRQFVLQSGLSGIIGIAAGHGIVLKDGHGDRHLIAHELGHVVQYERFGSIERFLVAYVPEVVLPPYYPNGPMEREAKRLANAVWFDGLTLDRH